MSDLLIGTIKAPPTGTDGRFLVGDALRTGLPASGGKSESSTGKQLPVQEQPEAQELQAVAQTLTAVSLNIGHDLRFIVDLADSQPIIQVLDSETGEVIRQIPAKELSTYSLQNGSEGIRLLDTLV